MLREEDGHVGTDKKRRDRGLRGSFTKGEAALVSLVLQTQALLLFCLVCADHVVLPWALPGRNKAAAAARNWNLGVRGVWGARS